MRALLDTNILITYLLSPDKKGTIQEIIESAFENKYTLLLPREVLTELKEKIIAKKYLTKHIAPEIAKSFTTALMSICEEIPQITVPIPEIGRDVKDDYLLAYAVVGEADYLVSGDIDLQVLKEIQGVKVVSPAEFAKVLKKQS